MKLIIAISLFIGTCFSSHGQSKEQVYAGVILHIMKFVEWPQYGDIMTVGIVNDYALTKALQTAAIGKKIHFKNVDIVKFKDQLDDLTKIDVLFFPKSSLPKLTSSISNQASNQSILVISEQKSSTKQEASINFTNKNGKLVIELYQANINRCGFKVSEQLKRLSVLK